MLENYLLKGNVKTMEENKLKISLRQLGTNQHIRIYSILVPSYAKYSVVSQLKTIFCQLILDELFKLSLSSSFFIWKFLSHSVIVKVK